jgi:DNA invertase Pin-like site-specific DNA recombinase
MKRTRMNGKGGHLAAHNGTLIAYARCSTADQDLGAQLDALKAAGASQTFKEKASGARGDRPQLARCIAALRPGDTLIVCRLDRLARNTRDLLNTLHNLSERGVHFRSLSDAWADTTTAHGRLMLTVLGGLAEFERSLIIARTSEGRARAKAAGVRFGRPRKLSSFQIAEALKRREKGEPPSVIAQSYRVSAKTISH